jgi:hypothetical protein
MIIRLNSTSQTITTGKLIQNSDVIIDDDSNMIADVSLDATDTAVTGVYDYQVNENFAVGDPLKYPDPDDCSDDCVFPTITICEAIDMAGTS